MHSHAGLVPPFHSAHAPRPGRSRLDRSHVQLSIPAPDSRVLIQSERKTGKENRKNLGLYRSSAFPRLALFPRQTKISCIPPTHSRLQLSRLPSPLPLPSNGWVGCAFGTERGRARTHQHSSGLDSTTRAYKQTRTHLFIDPKGHQESLLGSSGKRRDLNRCGSGAPRGVA